MLIMLIELSVESQEIQVVEELQAPHFVGCSELSLYCFQACLYTAFTKEKGIFKISVTIAMTACRLCGNSLLGKLCLCCDLLQ